MCDERWNNANVMNLTYHLSRIKLLIRNKTFGCERVSASKMANAGWEWEGEATLQGINLAREATFNRVVKTPLKLDDSADRLPHGESIALIVAWQQQPLAYLSYARKWLLR